jgi:GTP-binding protein
LSVLSVVAELVTEMSWGVVIRNAEFLFGAPSLTTIRKQLLPEVAIIGRSNVGKSTFINRLTGRKLARVSGNPGSTRELNFYRVAGAWNGVEHELCLVDMPGFGFAKLSKEVRESISRLSVEFLRERRHLRAVVLLNDCRREPGEDEIAIQSICASEGIPCIIVLTKFDTLRQNDKPKATRDVAQCYNLEPQDLLCTGEKVSVEAIWDRILGVIE